MQYIIWRSIQNVIRVDENCGKIRKTNVINLVKLKKLVINSNCDPMPADRVRALTQDRTQAIGRGNKSLQRRIEGQRET
jgi:hypothetical protein